MGKGRLEAFSDGVIAIIITIMVLELKVPHGTNEAVDMRGAAGADGCLLSYVLSFVFVGDLLEQPSPHAARVRARQPAAFCGRTCTCCSGCRWCRS